MVPPSRRFKPIQKLASHKERKAAAALGESLKQRQAAQQRLDELREYHGEYLQRFASATRAGVSSRQIMEYQVFINKLEVAIAQQEEIVSRSQQDCDSSKAQWRGRYSKSKAVEHVIERMHQAERKDQERKEQAESDEHAQRKR
jgi:flagellar FliJ protein